MSLNMGRSALSGCLGTGIEEEIYDQPQIPRFKTTSIYVGYNMGQRLPEVGEKGQGGWGGGMKDMVGMRQTRELTEGQERGSGGESYITILF